MTVTVLSVLSAKGSPGATTTALLTAALWPRPVLLVDADPAGGDVAVRLPAEAGGPLDADRGLLPLLSAARRGLTPAQVVAEAQQAAGGTAVVAGLAGPEQSAAAAANWPALATAVAEVTAVSGLDVVVDAGRTAPDAVHLPLLRACDVVVLVLRAEVGSVLHARERVRGLATALRRADGLLPRFGVVVVGGRGPRDVTQAVEAVRSAGAFVEGFGALPLDAAGARVFDGGRTLRPERTALVRAGSVLVTTLHAAATGGARDGRSAA